MNLIFRNTEKIIFSVAALAFIVRFVLLRHQSPNFPFLDADSWGYLGPSFYNESIFEMQQLFGRAFPYPTLLFSILNGLKSWSALVILHQIASLSALLLSLRCFYILIRESNAHFPLKLLFSLLAVGFIYLTLLNSNFVIYEQLIRPEAINTFLMILACYLFLKALFMPVKLIEIVLMGALPFFAYLFRPNIGVGVPFLYLSYALVIFFRHAGAERRRQMKLFGISTLAALSLFAGYQKSFGKNDAIGAMFLPLALFACHGPGLVDDLEKDLAQFPPEHTQIIRLLHKGLKDAMAPERAPFPKLGINPDFVMYGSHDIGLAELILVHNKLGHSVFWHYFLQYLKNKPTHYLEKVVRHLEIVYGQNGYSFLQNSDIDWRRFIEPSREISTIRLREFPNSELLNRHMTDLETWSGSNTPISADQKFVNDIIPILNQVFRWMSYLMLVFLVAGSLFLMLKRPKSLSSNSKLLIASGFLGSFAFAHHLSVAMVGSLETARYVEAVSPVSYLFIAVFSFSIATFVSQRSRHAFIND